MVTRPLTLAEIAGLPAVTDLVTAGRALGLGRTKAYELARAGQFPCPVIRAGKTWLVPTAGLLALLGLPVPGPAARTAITVTPAPGLPAPPRQCGSKSVGARELPARTPSVPQRGRVQAGQPAAGARGRRAPARQA